MVRQPKEIQRPTRVIDPITAVGALLILVAATAIITYTLLTVPGKLAAQSGPPDAFLAAATRQAERVAASTGTPDSTLEADTTQVSDFGSGSGATPVPLNTPVPASSPTATANPYGEWPLPDWVDEQYWLSIPAIGLEAPIIALAPRERQVGGITVFRLPVPNSYAVSWDQTSAQPGFPGNAILTGHSNLYGGVFQDLDELAYGAEIAIWSEYGVFSYYVSIIEYLPENDQPLDVRYENAAWLNSAGDVRVTLITCWPNSNSSHRLIVVGTR